MVDHDHEDYNDPNDLRHHLEYEHDWFLCGPWPPAELTRLHAESHQEVNDE